MNPEEKPAPGGFELLTGPGPAAIAVIRVYGPQTAAFVARHLRTRRPPAAPAWEPGRIWRAELLDADGAPIDDSLISVHAAWPAWDLRLHLHGNPWLVRHCAELLRACGLVQMAAAGSRTLEGGRASAAGTEPGRYVSSDTIRDNAGEDRTTLWPMADALEAEAYSLLPRMLTLRGAHWLLQQVDRLRDAAGALLASESWDAVRQSCCEIAGRVNIVDWFTRPLRVALAGPANVGKSTLVNALVDRAVSVVSPSPGTTRDWVEVPGEAAGFPVVWLDTAGLGTSADPLERAGIQRAQQLIQAADAVIVVLDATDEPADARAAFLDTYSRLNPACVALNKIDLGQPAAALQKALPAAWKSVSVPVSATRRFGFDALCDALLSSLGRIGATLDQPAAFTSRQALLLHAAAAETNCNTLRQSLLQLLGRTEPA